MHRRRACVRCGLQREKLKKHELILKKSSSSTGNKVQYGVKVRSLGLMLKSKIVSFCGLLRISKRGPRPSKIAWDEDEFVLHKTKPA
jgi:hypothetical protein